MKHAEISVVFGSLLLLTGCGAAPPPQHMRLADNGQGGAAGGIDFNRPIELEFQPGDRLPIRLEFSDQLFELAPAAPPLEFVAKRHGFVRIDGPRITTSLTGADFEAKPRTPGSFRFGLALTRQGSWVELVVKTPRHRETK